MSILVVGDGPRDESALPSLVCVILGCPIESRYDDWHHVTYLRGKGSIYARKLKYLTRRARADGFAALAVVVDTDKSPPRDKLRALRAGREDDRLNHPPFPTALGEANPHFDIWLLDDPVAVRSALRLSTDFEVPNARKVDYPKDTLSELVACSGIEFSEVSDALGAIARQLSSERCIHRNETGFAVFERDVRYEIKSAVNEQADATREMFERVLRGITAVES
jgi:hypothetical protein